MNKPPPTQSESQPRYRTACRFIRTLVWTAVLAGAGLSLAAESSTPAPAEPPLILAFSSSMFVDVNENDAGAAVRVWAQMLGRDYGIPVDPIAKILRGTNEIASAVRGRLADAVAMTAEEYWVLRRDQSFGSFIFSVKGGRTTDEYQLLVHRDSGIQRLADLRGRTLTIYQHPRTCLAATWLETVLAKENLGPTSGFFGRVSSSSKLTKALLPVFFRQSDACLVTRDGFATASELNPQVSQRLKPLLASPELVPTVFCFRADCRSPLRDHIIADIAQLSQTPAGRQFMTLFQCDTLTRGSESDLKSAFDVLATHAQLCEGTPDIKTGESAPASTKAGAR